MPSEKVNTALRVMLDCYQHQPGFLGIKPRWHPEQQWYLQVQATQSLTFPDSILGLPLQVERN